MLRTIKLYGELGRRFGKVHRLAVDSAAEAVRALTAVLPGFERALTSHPVGFHVVVDRDDRADAERLHYPVGEGEAIKIIPATAGAKSGFFQIILGAALIGLALFNPLAFFGASGIFGSFTSAVIGIGASLVLGGVSQLLSPAPKYDASSEDKTAQSYVFGGAVNSVQQGGPVPIGYGRMIVGSQVISQGITVQELPT